MPKLYVTVVCLLALSPAIARADDDGQDSQVGKKDGEIAEKAEKDADAKSDEKKDKKDKKKDKKKGKQALDDHLSFGGRVFVRGALTTEDEDPWTAQGTVASARVKADYKWESLRAELEFELTTRKLKNAYLRLRALDGDQKLDVYAGQFKVPFSEIQLTSGWTLPTADRGLIDSVLVNRLQVAGRHIGADVEVKLGGDAKPTLTAGVFQGTDDAGNPLATDSSNAFGQDAVARFTVEPAHGLQLGASAEVRSGQLLVLPVVIRHRWAADVDVTVDVPAGPGRARAWAEGYAGSSWLVAGTTPGHTKAIFAGGRAIAAYRFGGAKTSDCFVEPYALFGVIDPDSSFGSDAVVEATGGIGYGAWGVWRIQAEVEIWRIGVNAPVGIAELGIAPADTTTVLVQAGAHF